MNIEVAIISSGRNKSLVNVVKDLGLITEKYTELFNAVRVYTTDPNLIIDQNYQIVTLGSELTFDEKVLKLLKDCKSEYLWILNDHSGIGLGVADKISSLEFAEDYVIFCQNSKFFEKLHEIAKIDIRWLPLFGTFINNNIFKVSVILNSYESRLAEYNGTMLNFVVANSVALRSNSKVKIILSDEICYGRYKDVVEYTNSWQSSLNGYLNVALSFAAMFDDLSSKLKSPKTIKKLFIKYNFFTFAKLCRLSVSESSVPMMELNNLFQSSLYEGPVGFFALTMFKLRANFVVGLALNFISRIKRSCA